MNQAGRGVLLRADNLALERGGRDLFTALSFVLHAGELIQVEGENGAGKTSLMRILAGLSRYGFAGEVSRSASLLYLGHKSAVKALLSPRENLRWHPAGEVAPSTDAIDQALTKVGLFGYEDFPCHNLSAGQQRRVNLARLYLTESPLWLLDEPFTAIDKAGVSNLESHIADHVASGGGVVITSHQAVNLSVPIRRLSVATGVLS